MTLKAQDGGAHIQDILDFSFVQWEEVETRPPSLFKVYDPVRDKMQELFKIMVGGTSLTSKLTQ